MDRRGFLRGVGFTGGFALAGCLERLGFEERSAWRNPPLVEDRPEAVYLPASTETMGQYGTVTDDDGEYAVALSYTFPHRFWTVSGTETNRVSVDTDDAMHLMCTVWDPRTDTVLPVEIGLEIRREGERVQSINPWAMLSQRMGFHYGDNVQLPDEGTYNTQITVGPTPARTVGEFDGRFETARTVDIEFDYDRADVHELEFDEVDYDERGTRGALELMNHGETNEGAGDGEGNSNGDHHDSDEHAHESDLHPASSRGPQIDDLEGRLVGTESSADANISVVQTDGDRFVDDGSYLAIFSRTPYNDVILPFMSLTVTVERDDEIVFEDHPEETLDPEYGHHYGLRVPDGLSNGDLVTIVVDSHPQLARHDGYETAFFAFDDVQIPI